MQAQGPQELETHLESMAPRLTDCLSEELTERITTCFDAHFGTLSHELMEDIANESMHRAKDVPLDSDAFLEVRSEVSGPGFSPELRQYTP